MSAGGSLPAPLRGRSDRSRPTAMVFHRGVQMSLHMSALCFATPIPINLRRSSWTLRDDKVTCPSCRKLMKARGDP